MEGRAALFGRGFGAFADPRLFHTAGREEMSMINEQLRADAADASAASLSGAGTANSTAAPPSSAHSHADVVPNTPGGAFAFADVRLRIRGTIARDLGNSGKCNNVDDNSRKGTGDGSCSNSSSVHRSARGTQWSRDWLCQAHALVLSDASPYLCDRLSDALRRRERKALRQGKVGDAAATAVVVEAEPPALDIDLGHRSRECVLLLPPSQLPDMLVRYMYTGIVVVNAETTVSLIAAAEALEMPSLQTAAESWLRAHLTRDTVCSILRDVVRFGRLVIQHKQQEAEEARSASTAGATSSETALVTEEHRLEQSASSTSKSRKAMTTRADSEFWMRFAATIDRISRLCINVLARNFAGVIGEHGVNCLDFADAKTLERIARRDNLAVPNEFLLYKVVTAYCDHNFTRFQSDLAGFDGDDRDTSTDEGSSAGETQSEETFPISAEDVVILFSTVRFPFLSDSQMKEAEQNTLVPRALINEAKEFRAMGAGTTKANVAFSDRRHRLSHEYYQHRRKLGKASDENAEHATLIPSDVETARHGPTSPVTSDPDSSEPDVVLSAAAAAVTAAAVSRKKRLQGARLKIRNTIKSKSSKSGEHAAAAAASVTAGAATTSTIDKKHRARSPPSSPSYSREPRGPQHSSSGAHQEEPADPPFWDRDVPASPGSFHPPAADDDTQLLVGGEAEDKALSRVTRERRTSSGTIYSRLTPRNAFAISLEYSHDFDDRGVLYFIGSQGGTEVWTNPAARGRIRVSASSIEKGTPISLGDRVPGHEFWTGDVPSSWVQINLGSRFRLAPTYYTLRHGHSMKSDALRNWVLQGSVDGQSWTTLCRHINDTSLDDGFATATFPIDNPKHRTYTHFRVLQTSKNSTFRNYLALSGWELYGELYDQQQY